MTTRIYKNEFDVMTLNYIKIHFKVIEDYANSMVIWCNEKQHVLIHSRYMFKAFKSEFADQIKAIALL